MIDRCGKRFVAILIAFVGLVSSGSALAQISFTVSLPQTLVDAPVTGRLIVVATAQSEDAAAKVEPRQMIGLHGTPAFGVDVEPLAPGGTVTVDAKAERFPFGRDRDRKCVV